MGKILIAVFCLFVLLLNSYAEIEIYFGPNGGFSPVNRDRIVIMKDGSKVPATLNNSILQLLENVEEGGTIKIAMYSFSYKPILDALIDAAQNRNIKVKLLMDGVMPWSKDIRTELQTTVLEAKQKAKKEGRNFDFQIKETTQKLMRDRGRFKYDAERNETFYGSMHEKFGICFPKGCKIPLDGFCGSANFSSSASDAYAENRIIFKNEPTIGRQLAEEFARLWNEYGSPVTEEIETEVFIPSATDLSQVQIISNSKPVDEERVQRIDEVLMGLIRQVDRRNGSIDVAIFSFTHQALADKILETAQENPNVKVRILMDQCQLVEDDAHQGVLGEYLIKTTREKNLSNVDIRFKWRSNVYSWDEQKKQPDLIHFRNPLLHHKCMIINRQRMALGSYNWSSSAEYRNFENIMLFHHQVPEHKKIINQFLSEFDTIWNNLKKEGPATEYYYPPQVVQGEYGHRLKAAIIQILWDADCRKIMELLEGRNAGYSESDLAKRSKIPLESLREKLVQLQNATLIFKKIKGEQVFYQIAD